MKLYLGSDLHLEFGQLELHNRDNADVLILSGDILVAADISKSSDFVEKHSKHIRYEEFMTQASSLFKHVIYVMGNHEHYHGDFLKTESKLREFVSQFPNVHFLEKESITIDDVTFVGGTLWTDMNKEDAHTLYAINGVMNDFKIVTYGGRVSYFRDNDGNSHERTSTLMPADVVEDHMKMLEVIKQTVTADPLRKYVVVGHHAPSKLSTHPRYADEVLINGAYSSDLSEFILDHPQIKLWTHGHTHERFDYMIGTTRIVANPRGYIYYEDCADTFDFQLLEI